MTPEKIIGDNKMQESNRKNKNLKSAIALGFLFVLSVGLGLAIGLLVF